MDKTVKDFLFEWSANISDNRQRKLAQKALLIRFLADRKEKQTDESVKRTIIWLLKSVVVGIHLFFL